MKSGETKGNSSTNANNANGWNSKNGWKVVVCLQYSSPNKQSRNTDQARSSVNGFDVGTLSTSPSWTSSNTKYSESSRGSSSTSTNFTTFGWSNCKSPKEKLIRWSDKIISEKIKRFDCLPFSEPQFRDRLDPMVMYLFSSSLVLYP